MPEKVFARGDMYRGWREVVRQSRAGEVFEEGGGCGGDVERNHEELKDTKI